MPTGNQKDYFSKQAAAYAAFRPTYPPELYEFVFARLRQHDSVWDCATGNGQVAQSLAKHFQHVYATDISQKQLNEAVRMPNVTYSISPAEKTNFNDNQFDLITVGQALHWFDLTRFYAEVKRVGKPDALLACWGYGLLRVEDTIDRIITDYYGNIVGPYWDDARKLVEDEYRTLAFPFEEVGTPKFFIIATWTISQLMGYIETWSATQKYMKVQSNNPVPALVRELEQHWKPNEVRIVKFPVFLRLGRVAKG
jgi:SAM-dependent methyltransferase